MNIQITSRKFKAKDSLKDFITAEVQSLERFHDSIIDANVVLSFLHNKDSIKNAEIVLQVPGKILSAESSAEEFQKSVSETVQKLERQLKKLKTKKIAAKRWSR